MRESRNNFAFFLCEIRECSPFSRSSSTATIDRPFVGRSISYHPPPSGSPVSLVTTATPLPVSVPPAASHLGVFIPLTMPLNLSNRPNEPPPPPLPPKSSIRLVQTPQTAILSPLASPSSNPSPLSTPGRSQPPTLPNGYIAIPEAQYQLMARSLSGSSNSTLAAHSSNTPTPLSTPGREIPPQISQQQQQIPTLPPTSAQAAQLHATMVAAAVAAATAQIERSQSVVSSQTSSTSSSMTIMPSVLQAGGGGGIARKPVPPAFALSNAATQYSQLQPSLMPSNSPPPVSAPIRQLTLPEMVITGTETPIAPSIVPGYSSQALSGHDSYGLSNDPHRNVLGVAPTSIPLSRYGTRGASHAPQPVTFAPPQRSYSTTSLPVSETLSQPEQVRSETPGFSAPDLESSHSFSSSDTTLLNPSSSSLSLNRSKSSLALLAPLTKFPDPAFPRKPLVLSEHLSRFRASSAVPASPSSLWYETTDGKPGETNGDGTTKRRRKVLGTMFRAGGKAAAIKWVGKDGLLGEDERWTIQKWGLAFTVTTVSSFLI